MVTYVQPLTAIGQWTAGALSQANPRTTTVSVAEKRTLPYAEMEGKLRTLAAGTPVITFSEQFAQKAVVSGVPVIQTSAGYIVSPEYKTPDTMNGEKGMPSWLLLAAGGLLLFGLSKR